MSARRECTLYEVRDGAAWITLNRPEVRNALSAPLADHRALRPFDGGAGSMTTPFAASCITGAGKGFCAGAPT